MKDNIASMNDLAIQIKELEAVETEQMALLKTQALKVLEGFKPTSILKSTIAEIASSKDLKAGAVDISLGMGAGWLVRKAFQANSKNIFRKLTGFVLQTITTSIITRKMPVLRQKISDLQDL
ncbi:MAG: hypothetical protein IPP72_12425 [Chitinophagaceae bacterium]|nr:hypothetical protein [Chitinophagaceae bacterium]